MRRVVVTEMGIVSSIGTTPRRSWQFARGEVGIRALRSMRNSLQVPSPRRAEARMGRPCGRAKPKRFMNPGVAWNYIAMDQAIRDSGLEPGDVCQRTYGIIVAQAGRRRGDRRGGRNDHQSLADEENRAFEVPKAMCSGLRACHIVPDQGRELSIHRLVHERSLHRHAPNSFNGQAGHHFCGRLRGIDWTLSNLFDAMARCPPVSTTRLERLRVLRTKS